MFRVGGRIRVRVRVRVTVKGSGFWVEGIGV